MPSDKRVGVLFSEHRDIGIRTDIRDHHIEFWLIHNFKVWAADMESYESSTVFRNPLRRDTFDSQVVKEEYNEVLKSAPEGLDESPLSSIKIAEQRILSAG